MGLTPWETHSMTSAALMESFCPERQLEREADRILRENGCRRDGRKVGSVDFLQTRFEGRLILTPTGGQDVRHP